MKRRRQRLTGLLLVALAAAMAVAGCTAPEQSIYDQYVASAAAPWPSEVIAALDDVSAQAYGWQRCEGKLVEGEPTAGGVGSVSRTAAVYDPATDSGLLVVEVFSEPSAAISQELLESSGIQMNSTKRRIKRQWALEQGEMRQFLSGEWLASSYGLPGQAIPITKLRSLNETRAMFDFETVVQDIVNPVKSKPVVQQLGVPEDSSLALRLEGLPAGWPRAFAENDPDRFAATAAMAPGSATNSYSYGTSVVWLTDIWAVGDVVDRVRFQTQDEMAFQLRQYAELRFLSVDEILSDGDLVLPDCPTGTTISNDDWRGIQAWDQTRTVPLAVSLDPEGRPYDTELSQSLDIRREQIAELAIPGGELVVMDGNMVGVDLGTTHFES